MTKVFIDDSCLERLSGLPKEDMVKVFRSLIELFETLTLTNIKNLKKSIADKDYAEAKALSHKLKSSSANLGAIFISAKASEVEKLSGETNLKADLLMSNVDDMQEAYLPTLDRLKGLYSSLVGSGAW